MPSQIPNLIAQLFTAFAPIVREIIHTHASENDGELPSDEDIAVIFQGNIAKYLDAGAAWRASHPDA